MISDLHNTYLLRSVLSSGPYMQAILDSEGRFLELGETLAKFSGRDRGVLVNTPFIDLFEQDLDQVSLNKLGNTLEAAAEATLQLQRTGKPDLCLSLRPIVDSSLGLKVLLVQFWDGAAQAEPDLETLSLESKALGALPVGVIKQEADGTLSLYNEAAQRMLGLSREQLSGLTPPSPHLSISYDDGTPFFEDAWPRNLSSEFDEPPVNLILKVERPLHATRWLLMTTEIIEKNVEAQDYATLSALTDITEQRKQEERLRQAALFDPITALPMRALFAERLAQVIGKAKRIPRYCFAVLFVNLDDFKSVSGVAEQASGGFLIEVATQLKESLRAADTLARLGEDEFAILLDDAVVLADAVEVAERSLKVLARFKNEQGLNVSIGVLMGDKTCSSPHQVLNAARHAMLEAKDAGGGRYAVYRK